MLIHRTRRAWRRLLKAALWQPRRRRAIEKTAHIAMGLLLAEPCGLTAIGVRHQLMLARFWVRLRRLEAGRRAFVVEASQ